MTLLKGSIEPDPKKPGSYRVTGCYNKLDENTIEITELPIETWTTPYKEMLESFIIGTEKKPPILKVTVCWVNGD
jgi:DNA topoisomerase-2